MFVRICCLFVFSTYKQTWTNDSRTNVFRNKVIDCQTYLITSHRNCIFFFMENCWCCKQQSWCNCTRNTLFYHLRLNKMRYVFIRCTQMTSTDSCRYLIPGVNPEGLVKLNAFVDWWPKSSYGALCHIDVELSSMVVPVATQWQLKKKLSQKGQP